MRARHALLPLALALALVPAALAAPQRNACRILSRTEVEKAIGEKLATAQPGRTARGELFCNWTGTDSNLRKRGVVLIIAYDKVQKRYSDDLQLLVRRTKVPGVGTSAVTDGVAIFATNGKAMIQMQQYQQGGGVGIDAIVPLARLVLARSS